MATYFGKEKSPIALLVFLVYSYPLLIRSFKQIYLTLRRNPKTYYHNGLGWTWE